MLQAYPQGRPQEDPRVPLPWYVIEQYCIQPTLCACIWVGLDALKDDEKQIANLNLLIEGVLVAKKDFNLPKHGDIDTKNLYVRRRPFSRICNLKNILETIH